MASVGEAVIKVTADATGVEAGVGRARKSLATLAQAAGQTSESMTAGNERAARSIDRFVQKTQLAAATMGKSATEAKLFELAQRGASQAQLKAAESALKAVDAYNRQEAATARAQAAAARFGAAVAAGATVAAAAVLAIGRNSVDALDQFNDLADATGSSIEKISALDRIARENGQTFDTTASILVRFNKVLADTDEEGKKAAQVLKAMGLDAGALKRMDPADAIRTTAVAMSKFADDGNKARAVQELFGKSVQEAAPFLKDLAEKTELTGVASTKAAKDSEEFNKNLFRLKANAQDLARSLTSDLLPALNSVFDKMRENGGGFSGFASLFGFDKKFFEASDLAAKTSELKKFRDSIAKLEQDLSEQRAGRLGMLGTPEEIEAQLAQLRPAFEKAKQEFRDLYRVTRGYELNSTAGAGRGVVNPAPVTPSIGAIPDPPKGGAKKDPLSEAKQYLETLQKQLQSAREMTVYEKLLDDLQNKRLGSVTPQLRTQLEAVARQVDATKAQAKAEEEATKARERNTQMQLQADEAALASVEQQIQNNQQLREEIELLGLEGSARAAVEKARLSSAIALKEEELVMLRNADASAAQISALEREVRLLRERQGLIALRADREEQVKIKDDQKKATDDLRSDLTSALQRAFEDTKDPIRSFGQAIASVVYSRLTRSLAESLADGLLKPLEAALKQLTTKESGGGLLKGLFGSVLGAIFGGGGGFSDGSFGAGVNPASGEFMGSLEFHKGGLVGHDRTGRMVPAGTFAGARKYHGGGLAGDEVPAILRKGEVVFTPGQLRALSAASDGGGNKGGIHIVNNLPAPIGRVEQRETSDGDRVLVLEQAMVGWLNNPNSPVSKALGRNTTAKRSR